MHPFIRSRDHNHAFLENIRSAPRKPTPELQANAIQYRQLKKIINQIVKELSSLGLSPTLLHKLLESQDGQLLATSLQLQKDASTTVSPSTSGRVTGSDEPQSTLISSGHGFPRVVYEFNGESEKIEPRLRISVESLEDLGGLLRSEGKDRNVEQNEADTSSLDDDLEVMDPTGSVEMDHNAPPGDSLLWTLQKSSSEPQIPLEKDTQAELREVIIPLVSDSQFFELLYTTLEHMSAHLKSVEGDFMATLKSLSTAISDTARPASSSHSVLGGSFQALSPLKDNAGVIHVRQSHLSKSDLYSWREIFQLYMEAEVFESMHEQDRGDRSVEESERRLQLFAKQVTQRGLAAQGKFKLKQSRRALETFLQLNVFILDIRKFQLANSEATRKILKKHTKRTALALPPDASSSSHSLPQLALIPQVRSFSLPRALVQAISETLLPIIPHLDDYSCLICTSIAFKPIRLDCGHLFCVRCLVKMQKRGQSDCPMCRTPCVLVANRSNVDWALMNFMQDWFPLEAKEKLKANEKEATAEELAELGLDPNASCVIM
ncbi:hypothetical protein D9756_007262 [Leucocoprinus leucothites]|uniref:RING-14 protein n=1 Tax=Leucocoprinus leucothites TaxID=201217 RepID=A0A8H5D7Z5_9AGAR|nr:hypothetical protein D9756_007262 [Leucoagaricus leucothites]